MPVLKAVRRSTIASEITVKLASDNMLIPTTILAVTLADFAWAFALAISAAACLRASATIGSVVRCLADAGVVATGVVFAVSFFFAMFFAHFVVFVSPAVLAEIIKAVVVSATAR
jgi:hypothetical protein